MTRRKFFYSMVGAAAIYPAYIEPRWLRVVQTSVKLSHAPRLRILHVSDLHLSSVVPLSLIDTAISQGLALRPDIVCVTGDFITGKEDLRSGAYARTLSRLSAASPTFALLGAISIASPSRRHCKAREFDCSITSPTSCRSATPA